MSLKEFAEKSLLKPWDVFYYFAFDCSFFFYQS